MAKKKKNFIDFILAAQQEEGLLKEFAEAKNLKKLTEFFEKKGYEITKKDCKKLIEAKKEIGMTEWPIPPKY